MIITDKFVARHNGPRESDIAAMLKKIGANSVDELIAQTVPAAIRLKQPLNLPEGLSEYQYHKHLRAVALRCQVGWPSSTDNTMSCRSVPPHTHRTT